MRHINKIVIFYNLITENFDSNIIEIMLEAIEIMVN